MEKAPHIAILPSPGMGHLIPLVEFAKQLVHHHRHFSATILIPTFGAPLKAQLMVVEALPDTINYLFLPPVSLKDLPSDTKPERQIFYTINRSLPLVRDTLQSLIGRSNLIGLVTDMFGTNAFEVAKEFGVSTYLFFPMSAMCLSFSFYLPKLDENTSCQFRDLPDPIEIPGSVPIHGRDVFDPVQDRFNDAYKAYLRFAKRLNKMDGVFLNTFIDLEEEAIRAVQVGEPGRPVVYPIGPLIRTGSKNGSSRHECLKWLDDQPSGSVLFISFGSGGTLSLDQLHELAFGLEMSGQGFVWVLRSPNDEAKASYFSAQNQNDPLAFLPKGFLDRTKERGLVVPSWAPQIEVLSHGSTGGFLTHCGWNSILESLVNGVPLIAWPLFAEQKMNAVLLTQGLNAALTPKVDEDGTVRREEIAKVVKGLMEEEEGKQVRHRMKELKDAAKKVLDVRGSSIESLSKFASQWKS